MYIVINVSGNSIVGTCNGKSYSLEFEAKKYEELKAIAAKQHLVDTPEKLKAIFEEFEAAATTSISESIQRLTPYLIFQKGKYFLSYKGIVHSNPIPQIIANRLIAAYEKGLSVNPIVKFWLRLLRNPNFNDLFAESIAWYINQTTLDNNHFKELLKDGFSEEVARERATVFQNAITEEGLLCCYKVSREITTKFMLDENDNVIQKDRRVKSVDEITGIVSYKDADHVEDRIFEPAVQGKGGDPFYSYSAEEDRKNCTPGHIIRVGKIHELEDWSKVDCNPTAACVKGLHVGNLDYIRGYQNAGTVTHNVLIDPADIGAVVPNNTGALRVLRYYVVSSFAGVNRTLYHSSTYAKLADGEYEERVKAEVEKNSQALIAAQKASEEKQVRMSALSQASEFNDAALEDKTAGDASNSLTA